MVNTHSRKIAVTGSKGFVGSFLCKLLRVPINNQFDLPDGDIRDSRVCNEIAGRADSVVHLAAISGVEDCENDKVLATQTNAEGTFLLAETLANAGIKKRLIFASSSAVYGEAERYYIREDHATMPRSVYGITKLLAEEKILHDIPHERRDLEIIILRKSNLYGFGTFWKGKTVIDKFIDKYLLCGSFGIRGDGRQVRNYVHLMDVARLYKEIAQARTVRSGIYNVGSEEHLSVEGIADLINTIGEAVLGYKVPKEYVAGPSSGEVAWHDFKYDWSKARMEFNFVPAFTLDNYIKERLLREIRGEPESIPRASHTP
jgi:UDP-glucose 4-epimerase